MIVLHKYLSKHNIYERIYTENSKLKLKEKYTFCFADTCTCYWLLLWMIEWPIVHFLPFIGAYFFQFHQLNSKQRTKNACEVFHFLRLNIPLFSNFPRLNNCTSDAGQIKLCLCVLQGATWLASPIYRSCSEAKNYKLWSMAHIDFLSILNNGLH